MMTPRSLARTILALALMGTTGAWAGGDPQQGFTLKPVMLDAANGTGTTLGVDYAFKKNWSRVATYSGGPVDGPVFNNAGCGGYQFDNSKLVSDYYILTDCAAEIEVKGTLTGSAAKNPNKFIDLSAVYAWMHFNSTRAGTSSYSAGGQAKFETDQGFDNKQFTYGLRGTYTFMSPAPGLDFFGLKAGLARVDPSTDKARKAALGGAAMSPYSRAELDVFYKFGLPAGWKHLTDIELNYRHFQELGAPDAITQAGLQRQRMGLVRLNLDQNLFVQYSRGSQPFDTARARVVKIGLSYKIF
jgi:hypothetical protein